MYVCMYVCDQTPQTTEPICIKIIPANRAFYAVVILSVHPCVCQSQATRAIGYLDLKYLPNTMNILLSRERCFWTSVASPQRRSVYSNDNVNDVTAEWRTQSIYICGADIGIFQVGLSPWVFLCCECYLFYTPIGSSELGSWNSEIYENSSKQIKWRNFTFSYKLISI